MHLGIACSSKSTLGHASVARVLANKAIIQIEKFSKISVITDQYNILKPMNFFDKRIDLIELGNGKLPNFDLLCIETMPFHNDDRFDLLLNTLPQKIPPIEILHVGWAQNLPNISDDTVLKLKGYFKSLGMPRVVILHSEEICNGNCDICNLSSRIGYEYNHTGLLLPEKRLRWQGGSNKFCCLSGGGTQSAYIVEMVHRSLDKLNNLSCDFFAGPYSEVTEGTHKGINVIRNATNLFDRLHEYKFSICRSGYSTCCEHIASGVPTRFVPIDHSEQRTNAIWAGRYVRSFSIDNNGELVTAPPELPEPRSFSWQAVI
jgi:predicted glycosyltransferase